MNDLPPLVGIKVRTCTLQGAIKPFFSFQILTEASDPGCSLD